MYSIFILVASQRGLLLRCVDPHRRLTLGVFLFARVLAAVGVLAHASTKLAVVHDLSHALVALLLCFLVLVDLILEQRCLVGGGVGVDELAVW